METYKSRRRVDLGSPTPSAAHSSPKSTTLSPTLATCVSCSSRQVSVPRRTQPRAPHARAHATHRAYSPPHPPFLPTRVQNCVRAQSGALAPSAFCSHRRPLPPHPPAPHPPSGAAPPPPHTQFSSFTTSPKDQADNFTAVLLRLSGGAPPAHVLAAGHSLGAALSELTGVWAATVWPNASVLVANSGAPRVGDGGWELMFRAVVGRAYR